MSKQLNLGFEERFLIETALIYYRVALDREIKALEFRIADIELPDEERKIAKKLAVDDQKKLEQIAELESKLRR